MANLFKSTLPKYSDPKKGYNTSNDAYFLYGRYGSVIYYDFVFKTVDVIWLDNNSVTTNLPVNFIVSSGNSSSGYSPRIGDILFFQASRQNYGSGSYQAVGFLSNSTEATRLCAFSWSSLSSEYLFSGHRIPESGEIYESSSLGSSLFVSDIFTLDSGMVRIEGNNHTGFLTNSALCVDTFFSGGWHSQGMVYVPYAYVDDSGDDYSFNSVAPNIFDKSVNNNKFDSKIEGVIASDGRNLYVPTKEDSSKTIIKDGEHYVASDWLIADFVKPFVPVVGGGDHITKSILYPNDGDIGHIIRHGFGTKIGKNPNKKFNYARPIERHVFKEENNLEIEDEDKKKEPGVVKKVRDALSLAFWVNIFKESLEKAFFEIDKSGSLKFLFSGRKPDKNDSERRIDAVEGLIDGRVKLKIGKQEPENAGSSSDVEGPLPDFQQMEKPDSEGDSVYINTESGINIIVDGADSGGSGLFIDLNESSLNERVGKWFQREVEGKEFTFTKDRTYKSYGEKRIETVEDTATHFSKDRSFECQNFNIALPTEGAFKLGFGATIDELTGQMNGGAIVTVTLSGGEINVNWGGMNVQSEGAGTVAFGGNVHVGGGSLEPVGIRGSISEYSGNPDVHSNHRLSSSLSNSLKASRGGGGGGGNTRA